MRKSHVERRSFRYPVRQSVSDYEVGAVGMRAQGTVKFFNSLKGFGFCTRDGGGDVFIHANALRRSGIVETPKSGDRFEFDLIEVAGKAPKAENLKRL